MEGELNKQGERLGRVEEQLDRQDRRLSREEERMERQDERFDFMQAQLKEHGQMFSTLIHASEVHKADNDKLVHCITRLLEEMREGFNRGDEIQKSLMEMYGSHEAEIRALRRRPV